jgi:uncharacterized protein YndB with AHSA1/START domain
MTDDGLTTTQVFGGADCEIPLSTVSMDVRPGGAWRATMYCGPARHEIRWTGEYQLVAAPERLVFTISDQGRSELITVVLFDLGDGRTEMHFEQAGTSAPTATSAPRRAGASSSRGSTSGWPAASRSRPRR